MAYQKQLQYLLKISGKTQTELAQLLNVSFVTLNSWINGKSTPRSKAQERITTLFREYTGVDAIDSEAVKQKKKQIARFQKQFPRPWKTIISRPDLYDTFVLELTYHTNKIEGSTLTEPQVQAVLFNNATIPDKTIIEHQEAKNHQAALNMVFRRFEKKKKQKMTEQDILQLHSILMNGIRDDAGFYRNHAVRIVGAHIPTANPLRIPNRIKQLVPKLSVGEKNIFLHMARTHAEFEQIHPFSDGNGRVGRLILYIQGFEHNLPPVLIKQEKRMAYYSCLQKAQLQQEYTFLESFICDALLESYKLLSE